MNEAPVLPAGSIAADSLTNTDPHCPGHALYITVYTIEGFFHQDKVIVADDIRSNTAGTQGI